jgi:hypothetical protein
MADETTDSGNEEFYDALDSASGCPDGCKKPQMAAGYPADVN